MAQFDWNGNGKDDAFDTFMDMKMVSDVIEDNNDEYDGFDCDDTCCEDYENCEDEPNAVPHTFSETNSSSTNFQDELKQNLRSQKVVKDEKAQKALDSAMIEAKYTLLNIKKKLIQNAQNAQYSIQNGVTTVSCVYCIPQHFLRTQYRNNGEQIRKNQKTNFLMRDPHLVYRSWESFDIEPRYSTEFSLFMSALKKVANQENISIECVVHDMRENKVYPFPTDIPNAFGLYNLSVKASTSIRDDNDKSNISGASNTKVPINIQPTEDVSTVKKEPRTALSNTKESDDSILFKSILVIILCVIAFAMCISGNFGKLGMAVILIGAVIGGYYILKS